MAGIKRTSNREQAMIRIIRSMFQTGKKNRKPRRRKNAQVVDRMQIMCLRETVSQEMRNGQSRMDGKTMPDFILN